MGKNKPVIETRVLKSKDGKYLLHRTIITDIRPVKYFEKVMEVDPEY
jgi:hypothetical protein